MNNKPLILLVEDDAAVRSLMAVTLDTQGYRYHLAQNGAEALIEASTRQPAVMLLDLGLPDMEGVDIIRKVRGWTGMPIIVISARSEDADKVEALDAGADDYLTKPFSVDELLALPVSTRDGNSLGLFDSLFTATSAVCVTGLVAVDTGTTFSLFGQAVLLALIQVGGLGFMVFATRIMVMLGRRISIRNRMLIRESMNGTSLSNLGGVARLYLLLALGAALLAIRFIPLYGIRRGLWFAAFHAVSAFCNAGFDLFGSFASLTGFAADPLVLLTVAALIVLGGLGFSVILEVLRIRQGFRNLSLHSRIVLTFTPALLLAGTGFYMLVERGKPDVLNAFFQSVTMRTAGFNSIDLSSLTDGSKLFSSLLMMVGASPASTGGGMKTTTVALVILLIFSVVKGDNGVNAARRRIPADTVRRGLAVVALFLTVLILGALSLSIIEDGRFSLADILFECASAMGTVGVSSIGTPNLRLVSRAVLLPMMFLGRVGPLTLAVAIARRQSRTATACKYPEERIMIG